MKQNKKFGILLGTCCLIIYIFVLYAENLRIYFPNPTSSSTEQTIPKIIQYTCEQSNNKVIYNKSFLHDVLYPKDNSTWPTVWELNFVLILRKLTLWSVREVNLKILGLECSRWWANPRKVHELAEIIQSKTLTTYKLTFEIQPGRILFQTVVTLQKGEVRPGGLFDPDDLTLVSGRRLDVLPKDCGTIPNSLREICLCPEEKIDAEKKTAVARAEWEVNDPELFSWPPNSSFLVPDYMTYGTMATYIKSPVNNTRFCGLNLEMIIFVSTSPNNFEGRMSIRKTYANVTFLESNNVQLLFALDKDPNRTLQQLIVEEFDQYDDIIQASHDHSYHNLSLRGLSMFNWLVTQCRIQGSPMPRWIIKSDDDFFINVPRAVQVAAANPVAPDYVMGLQNCGQPVIRDVEYMEKYYTPRYMYPSGIYTGYISGATWLVRSSVLPLILKASLTTPMLHVEDVYITGMLTREIGIRVRLLPMMTYETDVGPCRTKIMLNSAVNDSVDFGDHWKYFNEPIPENCQIQEQDLQAISLTNESITQCLFP